MHRTVILAGILALIASEAALAQLALPRNNPVERQIVESNRAVERQQRIIGDQQQLQFELNQLRQRLDRQPTFSPPAGTICAPGQIGC